MNHRMKRIFRKEKFMSRIDSPITNRFHIISSKTLGILKRLLYSFFFYMLHVVQPPEIELYRLTENAHRRHYNPCQLSKPFHANDTLTVFLLDIM